MPSGSTILILSVGSPPGLSEIEIANPQFQCSRSTRTILYVFDRPAKIKIPSGIRPSACKVILCPLTVDQGLIESVKEQWKEKTQQRVEIAPYLNSFHAKAFAMKDEFIGFISEFARTSVHPDQNIKSYFKAPWADFSLWWTSLVVEKNPAKSNSYNSLVALLTILEICEQYHCEEVLLDITDQRLSCALELNLKDKVICRNFHKRLEISEWIYGPLHVMKGFWRQGVLLYKSCCIKFSMRAYPKRGEALKKSRFSLVTYFPLIDQDAWRKGQFLNKFYGSLQAALEKEYKDRLSWLAMTVYSHEFDFWKSIGLAKKINDQQQNFFFLEEFLSLKDFFLMLAQYSIISLKFILKAGFIQRNFRYSPKGAVIWPLFRREWYSSFCGVRLMEGLQYYYLFSRYAEELPAESTVTYMAEIQAWEKALNVAVRKRKTVRCVGIQHSTIPLLWLVYFNPDDDLKEKDFIQSMPQPHYMGCVGEVTRKFFIEGGWDPKKIFILGPLRFQYLKNNLKYDPSKMDKKGIVVALCISRMESAEVLSYVYHAFKDKREFKILIKEHPFCPMSDIKKSWQSRSDLDHLQFVTTPLNQLLPTTKILIVAESSSAIEGISCYCHVIVPKLATVADKNPLTGISDLPVYVYNPEEMLQKTQSIIDSTPNKTYDEDCRKLVERYFSFTLHEEEYLARLKQGINIK